LIHPFRILRTLKEKHVVGADAAMLLTGGKRHRITRQESRYLQLRLARRAIEKQPGALKDLKLLRPLRMCFKGEVPTPVDSEEFFYPHWFMGNEGHAPHLILIGGIRAAAV
jgi:hypothetical protein